MSLEFRAYALEANCLQTVSSIPDSISQISFSTLCLCFPICKNIIKVKCLDLCLIGEEAA